MRRRGSVWRGCWHNFTQKVFLCKIVLLSVCVASVNLCCFLLFVCVFFWTSLVKSLESISWHHCWWNGIWTVPSCPLQGGFPGAFGLNAAVTEPWQKRRKKKFLAALV